MATSGSCQWRGAGPDDTRDHKEVTPIERIDSGGFPMLDDYSSESDVDTEPAKAFHRKISTYKEITTTVRWPASSIGLMLCCVYMSSSLVFLVLLLLLLLLPLDFTAVFLLVELLIVYLFLPLISDSEEKSCNAVCDASCWNPDQDGLLLGTSLFQANK